MTLDQYLTQSGLTLTQFAALVGATPSMVHDWRSGRRAPSGIKLADIERATTGAVTAVDFHPLVGNVSS